MLPIIAFNAKNKQTKKAIKIQTNTFLPHSMISYIGCLWNVVSNFEKVSASRPHNLRLAVQELYNIGRFTIPIC